MKDLSESSPRILLFLLMQQMHSLETIRNLAINNQTFKSLKINNFFINLQLIEAAVYFIQPMLLTIPIAFDFVVLVVYIRCYCCNRGFFVRMLRSASTTQLYKNFIPSAAGEDSV